MSATILAIDPGPESSAWVSLKDDRLLDFGIARNYVMLAEINRHGEDMLAVEMIASYGMAVGAEVFGTAVWAGRFIQRWEDHFPGPYRYVYRRDVKLHLCGSARAKDANVRQALIDRYGPGKAKAIGLKATPGPLYGMKSHLWSALAVAVTVADNEEAPPHGSASG